VDNCPTVYNAPDPVFQIQADSDLDGAGDDRANTDTRPGAQNYCDPDSTDDNSLNGPDDLIQFLAELDCNYTQFGIGRVASAPNVVGAIALQAVSMADDGSSDYTCTTGDPFPYNNSATVEACVQETTLDTTPGNDASCNTPAPLVAGDYCPTTGTCDTITSACTAGATGRFCTVDADCTFHCGRGTPSLRYAACATDTDCRIVGDGHCAATPDGTADPGELAQVTLKLANSSVDSLGAARSLTNASVGIRATTPAVGCVPNGQTTVFTDCAGSPTIITTIPGGAASFCTTAGALNFVVNPANPGPGRSNTVAFAEAGFAVTAQADDLEGYAPLQTFKFFADLDVAHFPMIPTRCPGGAQGELCEDFDTERNGVAGYQWSRLPLTASPTDTLRADGDLGDDIFGFTMSTGPSPFGTDARTCAKDVGRFATCTPVPEENDWHLHAVGAEADALNVPYDGGANNRPGISAPGAAGGKAHSGLRSMHWGRHTDATNTLGDTSRYRQIAAFVIDSQHTPTLPNNSPGNDPTLPGIVIGPGSTLEFWHIVSLPDDENAGNGFVSPGQTFGGTQVQVSLLGTTGNFERWQVVTPTVNGYDSIVQGTISICEFDPGDDQLPPANETMCNRSPMWADIGDMQGTDATCTIDTDGNDPPHKDCGDTSTRGAAFIQNGSTGVGVWAKSAFSLSAFAGRVARLRFIGMEGGGWSFGISRSFLEPAAGGTAYQYFDADDGWYIDDIKLTDLREIPGTIGPDTVTGLTQCVTGNNVANCGTITPTIANSSALPLPTDSSGRRLPSGTGTLVGGQLIVLDARASAATGPSCLNGVLLFQWDEISPSTGAVVDTVQSFSPEGKVTVAPGRDTTYRVSIKCSSDVLCAATRDVQVVTRDLGAVPGTAGDISLEVVTSGAFAAGQCPGGGTNATSAAVLRWPSVAQISGAQNGYDVYKSTVLSHEANTTGACTLAGPPINALRCTSGPVDKSGVCNTSTHLCTAGLVGPCDTNVDCSVSCTTANDCEHQIVNRNTNPPTFRVGSCYENGNVPQPVGPVGTLVTDGFPDDDCPTLGTAFLYQVGHRRAGPIVMQLPIGIESPCDSKTNPATCGRSYSPVTACP